MSEVQITDAMVEAACRAWYKRWDFSHEEHRPKAKSRMARAIEAALGANLSPEKGENERLRKALENAAEQLSRVHDDAFTQAAGYGLVTSDGRDFSCFQLNVCSEAATAARAVLNTDGK